MFVAALGGFACEGGLVLITAELVVGPPRGDKVAGGTEVVVPTGEQAEMRKIRVEMEMKLNQVVFIRVFTYRF